jgi:hypothetical protein
MASDPLHGCFSSILAGSRRQRAHQHVPPLESALLTPQTSSPREPLPEELVSANHIGFKKHGFGMLTIVEIAGIRTSRE